MNNVTEITNQILATLASPPPDQTTENSGDSSYRDKMKLASEHFKRNWINKRLNLDHHHPDLIHLEESIWSFCRGIAINPKQGKRYVIFGNNGTGKSRCSKAVSKWIKDRAMDLPLVDADEGVRIVDCELVNWAVRVSAFYDGDFNIEPLFTATILILDDIGAEHDPKKIGVEKLYELLERREKKWTLITTNLPPKTWESRFERRISDRLFRNSVHVDLTNVTSYSINT
jgi:DNA replication protein DnaC